MDTENRTTRCNGVHAEPWVRQTKCKTSGGNWRYEHGLGVRQEGRTFNGQRKMKVTEKAVKKHDG